MSDIKVRVGDQNAIRVVSAVLSSDIPEKISDLSDFNAIPPIEDGNILIYNQSIEKWENKDEVDGGYY